MCQNPASVNTGQCHQSGIFCPQIGFHLDGHFVNNTVVKEGIELIPACGVINKVYHCFVEGFQKITPNRYAGIVHDQEVTSRMHLLPC